MISLFVFDYVFPNQLHHVMYLHSLYSHCVTVLLTACVQYRAMATTATVTTPLTSRTAVSQPSGAGSTQPAVDPFDSIALSRISAIGSSIVTDSSDEDDDPSTRPRVRHRVSVLTM